MNPLTPSGHMPLEAHEAHLRNWSEMYALEVPDDGREPQEQQPFEREPAAPRGLVLLAIAMVLVAIAACVVIVATERSESCAVDVSRMT